MPSLAIRKLAGLIVGATVGGIVGYTQVLCPDGQCALTGSWYGGAAVGGLAGMILLGGGCCSGGSCSIDPDRRPRSEPQDNAAS